MLKNALKFIRPLQPNFSEYTRHFSSKIKLNESLLPEVISESKLEVLDSEKRAKEREQYRVYREYLESRYTKIIDPEKINEALKKD